jgi:hypothetical protein
MAAFSISRFFAEAALFLWTALVVGFLLLVVVGCFL